MFPPGQPAASRSGERCWDVWDTNETHRKCQSAKKSTGKPNFLSAEAGRSSGGPDLVQAPEDDRCGNFLCLPVQHINGGNVHSQVRGHSLRSLVVGSSPRSEAEIEKLDESQPDLRDERRQKTRQVSFGKIQAKSKTTSPGFSLKVHEDLTHP